MTTPAASRLPVPGRPAFAASLVVAVIGTLAFIGVLVGGASPARAQQSDPETRPTRGPFITGAVRAGDADATAVELNPAQLGLLPGGSLELVGTGGTSSSATASRMRRGAGLYWGAPILGPHALGAQLAGVSDAGGFDGHTVLRLAYALRLGRTAAIGASWGHIWGGAFAGTDTFDFGVSARAGRYAALAVTLEDAWQPSSTPRLWNAELAVRPTGTDRLEVALGAAHANADEWKRIVPRARLSVT